MGFAGDSAEPSRGFITHFVCCLLPQLAETEFFTYCHRLAKPNLSFVLGESLAELGFGYREGGNGGTGNGKGRPLRLDRVLAQGKVGYRCFKVTDVAFLGPIVGGFA